MPPETDRNIVIQIADNRIDTVTFHYHERTRLIGKAQSFDPSLTAFLPL